MRKLCCLVLLLSLPVACATDGARVDPATLRTVSATFSELDRGHRPGAAVLVTHRGQTFYENYFGHAHLEHRLPITSRTRFNAGSVAKQIVGYIVLRLVDAGELELEAPVGDYLDGMAAVGEAITLGQLLHHTNGLRDGFSLLAMAGWRHDDVITDTHLRQILRGQETTNHAPGHEFSYTNSGYTLLAEIIEQTTGASLEEVARSHLFEPLEMHDSLFLQSHQTVIPDLAYSFQISDDGWRHARLNSGTAGAGGLITTARDLSRWLNHLLDLRRTGDPMWAGMVRPGLLMDGSPALSDRGEMYGAGLFIVDHRGRLTVGHGGGVAGYEAAAYLVPDQDLAVVVLMNGPWRPALGLAYGLIETGLRSLGVDLAEEPAELQDYRGEADLDLIQAAAGLYTAPQPRRASNLPDHIGVGLIERDGALGVAVLGERLEMTQLLSPFEFRTREWSTLHLRLTPQNDAAPAVELDFGDGFVPLERVDCPPEAQNPAELSGRYWSGELQTAYYLEPGEERITVRHSRHGSGWLLCLRPDLYQAAGVSADNGWGFTTAEVRRDSDGRVQGLYLSFGERTRRVAFDKVTP